MAEHTFHLSVVTPERVVLETESRSVVLPAYDGELGILAHRAPLLARLGAGRLHAETTEGEEVYFVDGGFAQMVDNRLTVLTEQAVRPEKLDKQVARLALEEALALPAPEETAQAAKARAVASARARLRLAP
jgi:F-type H+-transporting ATPase subunit epsilon